jgi:membrane-associated phospholipid phosphatase
MKKLIYAWNRYVNPYVSSLIAAIGTAGLVICLLVLVGLSKLFLETWEKESFKFDTAILLKIHQWSSPSLDGIALNATRLANPEFVVVIVISSLLWLGWHRKFAEAKFFAVACLGALILNNALKLFFAKTRPELWPRLITETTFSFPSGHALGSLVLYGFLAYLLANYFPKFSYLIYGGSAVLIASIGMSRLYLGVHWPTDVIAGYGVGFLWLVICITMLKLDIQARELRRQ